MNKIKDIVNFDSVRYANCWEDADVLLAAMSVMPAESRFVSIASAGDNVLALLTLAPERVIAVDISLPQIACLELRMAAFASLEYEDVLAFLGVTCCDDRIRPYRQLRRQLSKTSRAFWDQRPDCVQSGIIHAGKFERYFTTFRRLLALIHPQRRVRRLLGSMNESERRTFFDEEWNTRTWQLIAKVFFSRRVMGWLGRDPAFFDQVDGPVADRILAKVERALTTGDTASNPYLRCILTGEFGDLLPAYLRREHFLSIRERLEAIRIVHGDLRCLETRRVGAFDGFNLSDIFEYMDVETFAACANRLAEMAAPGAMLVYWNMLVRRRLPEQLPAAFCTDEPLSRCLPASARQRLLL